MSAIEELFNENFRRMVRMPFLLKALRNILEGRCMNQSISIAISVIKGYNTDSAHYSNTTVDDIDDDEPEDQ